MLSMYFSGWTQLMYSVHLHHLHQTSTDFPSTSKNGQMKLEISKGRTADFYLKVRDFQCQLKLSQYIQCHPQSRIGRNISNSSKWSSFTITKSLKGPSYISPKHFILYLQILFH